MMTYVQNFLTKNIFSAMSGYTFKLWLEVLLQNKFKISPRYWPRAFFITISSLVNSNVKNKDDSALGLNLSNIQVKVPVFILGHWRSGTTLLHNILSNDQDFSSPDFVQVTQPFGFLTNGDVVKKSKIIQLLTPKTRLIDNMAASLDAPMEDEVALTVLCGLSPVNGFVFPKNTQAYDKFLTFKNASNEERKKWQQSLLWFAKKMTFDKEKQLLFKSPPHTCRIKMILEVFPDAKFIHIHRNPYKVFQSYKKSAKIMQKLLQLQVADNSDFDEKIMSQYHNMYSTFMEDVSSIPPGNFAEIAYKDLELTPIETLQGIYKQLDLKDFEIKRPVFEKYLNILKGYKKTKHKELPENEKEKIYSKWKEFFKYWGYER